METLINKTGITIKELKELVKDLPEVDEESGDDYELWVSNTDNPNLSNAATIIMRLNRGDLLVSIAHE